MNIWPTAWNMVFHRIGLRVRCLWPSWLKSGGDTLLLGIAAIAAALTVWMVLEVGVGSTRPPEPADAAPDSLAARPDSLPQQDNLHYCLTNIASKRVFKRPQIKSQVGRESTSPARAVASVLAADYKLAGIIGGDQPKALLRNKKTNTLHYGAVGEMVGDLMVKEIRERSVILEANGEEIEISL